ncbi:transglutaminase-like domain-containing protein [Algoriphagus machipongonensis]|uniref:DUF3857 domain-containing protein n=1 Tax=Algoriphagus machipongonensis TaxID=388413 RepID=A3HUV2_9BACT|nr:DUF3857 domain-containing protein [Algoriphagus machipongonensis]EAZ81924.1 hypothetical protein ALPR1_01745 [Algoriphagus machipongonensis]
MNNHCFLVLIFLSFISETAFCSAKDSVDIYSELTEKQVITVTKDFEVKYYNERTITVFSNEGLDHAYTSLSYDRLSKIENFQLEVINPKTGKTLEKAKLRDMSDVAIYSTSSVFDDNRRKYYEVKSGVFPIKIKIITETKSSSNFFLRTWIPVHRYNQKIKNSSITVNYPKEIGLRYKELNLLGTREEKEEDGMVSITWEETDLPIQEPDFEEEDDHRLLIAPVKFGMEEYSGEMGDWSGLADWLYKLNEGRDQLPEDLKKKIHALTDELESSYEKVEVLYTYLQQNFRYVSIQLGIGGWQTMSSEEVAKYAYGDCKGLSNIMKAMLAEVGIDSNYTLVFAGEDEEDIEVDFPSNQFNHVILQVPTDKDPIWLECTSNLLPAGYLGSFTKDRHVLVTTKGGGYLTKTPSYKEAQWNQSKSETNIKIDPQGNALIETDMQFEGNFAEDLMYVKNNLDERKQKDFFNRTSPVSGLIVTDLSIDLQHQDSIPVAKTSYKGFIQKFTQNTSKRVILKSFMGDLEPEMFQSNRLVKTDSFRIDLGDNLTPESSLEPLYFQEEGNNIAIVSKLDGNILNVTREIEIDFSDELEDEAKKELIKKINSKAVKTYIFLKSDIQTN